VNPSITTQYNAAQQKTSVMNFLQQEQGRIRSSVIVINKRHGI